MKKIYLLLFFISFVFGCASHKVQILKSEENPLPNTNKQVEKRVFLVGDAGGAKEGETTKALKAFQEFISNENTKNDALVFLGDNIYEKGLYEKDHPERPLAEHRIDVQIDAANKFDGEVLFIPGNHDWYHNGLKSLKEQEKYIEKALGKNTFQPENGCPIETIDLSDSVVVIVIDTQWYLTNWDHHPTMNDTCEIKSRQEFIDELEGELKKNNGKTVVLAMHHPAYTYGPHGGGFSAAKHLFPFQNKIPMPVLASLVVQLRAQGGVTNQDRNNKRYDELIDRVVTLVRGNDRVVLVSGHEHSLQYSEDDGVQQIVSGSGAKESAAKLGKHAKFTYGRQGFAVLTIFSDKSSEVSFYSAKEGIPERIYTTVVHEAPKPFDTSTLPTRFNTKQLATTYKKEDTEKGASYQWFWGDHYRYIYGTPIEVPVATLDTLYGGLTIERGGGGHQTRSLRLIDKNERNFALRAVKKSATRYLQTVLFTNTYVEKDFEETITENLVLDFYTASHPFATFAVASMADAVGVYHTNPKLLYMPKHAELGDFNSEFGDELYIIEERPDDGFLDVESFGKPDAIESTSDVRKKLRRDEKYQIDEPAFVRARLFDMLLGDWDRHQDQWRWSRFDVSKDKRVYRPIPRDRDQVFSNYDGALLDVLRVLAPPTGQLQTFDSEIKDIKWLNAAGGILDRTFLQTVGKDVWIEQAKLIQENLTNEVIEASFLQLPPEVQDETTQDIQNKLKTRRAQLVEVAEKYYDYLARLIVITGTDKDDLFEITRGEKITTIKVYRIKKGDVSEPYKERVIKSNETNEVWLYGLDDDDQFIVKGEGSKPVYIRIIGGQNNDIYTIENGRKVKIHEHKSKPNTFLKTNGAKVRKSDIYEINTYDYERRITRSNNIIPQIGGNPDDGILFGITNTYTISGFKENPFHQRHSIGAQYYLATSGFQINYKGEFASVFGTWNLTLDGRVTTDNFTRNFFGFGNNTDNIDDQEDIDFDFNRVRTAIREGHIGVVKYGEYGGSFEFRTGIENIQVEDTPNRFTTNFFSDDPEVFEAKTFATAQFRYQFQNFDNSANPARGMAFSFASGVTSNLEETQRTFGFVHPKLAFYNAITRNQRLVLKTMAQGQFNIGRQFEFYQAAVLGDNAGLRGFRTERFSGQSAFAAGGDLRYSFKKFKTLLLPVQLGIYGGYDIGRVWLEGESSNIWHDSLGGGFFINAIDALSGELGVFNSDDGIRFSFKLGVAF